MNVPGLLAGFRDAHPGVDITLAEDTSDRLLDGLLDGRYDLAFVGLAGDPPDGVDTQTVIEDAVVAAVGPGDPLAGKRSVPLAALAGRPLIVLPRGTGLRAAVDAGCAAAGFRPRIAFEAGNPEVLVALAERGLGVAMVPAAGSPPRRGLPGVRPYAAGATVAALPGLAEPGVTPRRRGVRSSATPALSSPRARPGPSFPSSDGAPFSPDAGRPSFRTHGSPARPGTRLSRPTAPCPPGHPSSGARGYPRTESGGGTARSATTWLHVVTGPEGLLLSRRTTGRWPVARAVPRAPVWRRRAQRHPARGVGKAAPS